MDANNAGAPRQRGDYLYLRRHSAWIPANVMEPMGRLLFGLEIRSAFRLEQRDLLDYIFG